MDSENINVLATPVEDGEQPLDLTMKSKSTNENVNMKENQGLKFVPNVGKNIKPVVSPLTERNEVSPVEPMDSFTSTSSSCTCSSSEGSLSLDNEDELAANDSIELKNHEAYNENLVDLLYSLALNPNGSRHPKIESIPSSSEDERDGDDEDSSDCGDLNETLNKRKNTFGDISPINLTDVESDEFYDAESTVSTPDGDGSHSPILALSPLLCRSFNAGGSSLGGTPRSVERKPLTPVEIRRLSRRNIGRLLDDISDHASEEEHAAINSTEEEVDLDASLESISSCDNADLMSSDEDSDGEVEESGKIELVAENMNSCVSVGGIVELHISEDNAEVEIQSSQSNVGANPL